MASLSRNAAGFYRLLFANPTTGKRHAVYLGKLAPRSAEAIHARVESLVSSTASGLPLDAETARWLGSIGDELANKLAAVGLVPARERLTLRQFLGRYLDSRRDTVHRRTHLNDQQVASYLVDCFGDTKPITSFTAEDGPALRSWLTGEGYARATVSRALRRARTIFRDAVEAGRMPVNPLAKVKAGDSVNSERSYFVDRCHVDELIRLAPDSSWRLIISLSRYGGLRVPSELAGLRWADVDWERRRFYVRAPKTGTGRWVPIFPELEVPLSEAFELAAEGDQLVFPKVTDDANLRTGTLRLIEAAKLTAWPRVFHNMRASRQTELVMDHPIHVVCSWLGNSPAVAAAHYLQVREVDFQRALQATRQTTQNGPETLSPTNRNRQATLPEPTGQASTTEARAGPNSDFVPERSGTNRVLPGVLENLVFLS